MTSTLHWTSVPLVLVTICLITTPAQGQLVTKRIFDCNTTALSLADCDVMTFVYKLSCWLVPGVFTAFLLLFFCPFYCCGKYCCNCCGGRNQTPNFCFPALTFPARYSKGDILRPKGLLFVGFLMMGGGGGWGYFIGVSQTSSSLTSMLQALRSIGTTIATTATQLSTAFTVKSYDPVTHTYITKNLFAGGPVESAVNLAKGNLTGTIDAMLQPVLVYFDYVNIALTVACAAPAGLGLICLILAVANLRQFGAMTIMWLTFLVGFAVWFLQGILSILSVALEYACDEFIGLRDGQNTVIVPLSSCNEAPFVSSWNQIRSVESTTAQTACLSMLDMCYVSSQSMATNVANHAIFDCSSITKSCPNGMMFHTALSMSRSMVVTAAIAADSSQRAAGVGCSSPALQNSCTMWDCATDCLTSSGALSSIGEYSLKSTTDFQAASNVSLSIQTIGRQFGSCSGVLNLFTSSLATPCSNVVSGLTTLRMATALIGGGMLFLLYTSGWGAKRFISTSMANEPIDPEIEPNRIQDDESGKAGDKYRDDY